jgi:hypothetical protein
MKTLQRIPTDQLHTVIGKPIHLAWANKGCVWILDKIEGDKLHLHTPKTKKPLIAAVADACYVRRDQK